MSRIDDKHTMDSEYVLALDTATTNMTIALFRNGVVIDSKESAAERNHSILLVPAIRSLLADCGVAARDIGAIAMGLGPGSYTGVRIGVTVAKTLSWAHGIKLLGVSSLEALAYGAAKSRTKVTREWIVPVLNARRGQAYTALFERVGGAKMAWRRMAADRIIDFAEWLTHLCGQAELPEKIVFAGEIATFRDAVSQADEQLNISLEASEDAIHADDVGELALRYGDAALLSDVHRAVPNYTQLAEAEVKLLEKLKQ